MNNTTLICLSVIAGMIIAYVTISFTFYLNDLEVSTKKERKFTQEQYNTCQEMLKNGVRQCPMK